jgi:hypothetical protein
MTKHIIVRAANVHGMRVVNNHTKKKVRVRITYEVTLSLTITYYSIFLFVDKSMVFSASYCQHIMPF